MLAVFLGLLAVTALVVGTAFVLSKAVPRMPNKLSRFILLFVVGLLLWLIYGYVKHWALRYHESPMSLPAALIGALLWALLYPLWGPPSQNSKAR